MKVMCSIKFWTHRMKGSSSCFRHTAFAGFEKSRPQHVFVNFHPETNTRLVPARASAKQLSVFHLGTSPKGEVDPYRLRFSAAASIRSRWPVQASKVTVEKLLCKSTDSGILTLFFASNTHNTPHSFSLPTCLPSVMEHACGRPYLCI